MLAIRSWQAFLSSVSRQQCTRGKYNIKEADDRKGASCLCAQGKKGSFSWTWVKPTAAASLFQWRDTKSSGLLWAFSSRNAFSRKIAAFSRFQKLIPCTARQSYQCVIFFILKFDFSQSKTSAKIHWLPPLLPYCFDFLIAGPVGLSFSNGAGYNKG